MIARVIARARGMRAMMARARVARAMRGMRATRAARATRVTRARAARVVRARGTGQAWVRAMTTRATLAAATTATALM